MGEEGCLSGTLSLPNSGFQFLVRPLLLLKVSSSDPDGGHVDVSGAVSFVLASRSWLIQMVRCSTAGWSTV